MMSLVGRYIKGGLVDMQFFVNFSCLEHLHDNFSDVKSDGS